MFEGDIGSSYLSDIAIDDIKLQDFCSSPGMSICLSAYNIVMQQEIFQASIFFMTQEIVHIENIELL